MIKLFFNELLGVLTIDKKEAKTIQREAVRAVIFRDHQILLIHSNKGDYKLPGGGVQKNESHAEGLLREIVEETGYSSCIVKDKIGEVIERRKDNYEQNAYFEMTSHYYLCEIASNDQVDQQLDDYEAIQEFTPRWITIDEAIEQNQKILNQLEKNSWINREIFVLKELKKFL